MAGKYVVHQVRFTGSLAPPARRLAEIRYPPEDTQGVVNTELQLWQVAANIGGFFTYSYWRSITSFLNPSVDYNIILNQKDPVSSQTITFVVHETEILTKSEEAFERLRSTIEPLVDECNVMLTKELLSLLVLPEPVEQSKLSHHLINVMRLHPRAHPDWFTVVQSLKLSALRRDDDKALDALCGESHTTDVADRDGNGALHLASSGRVVRHLLRLAKSEEEKEKMLSQTNAAGKTALEVALETGKPDVVGVLLEHGALLPPKAVSLHVAAQNKDTGTLTAAFKRKAGFVTDEREESLPLTGVLNSLDEQGLTPLMISALYQHLEGLIVFLQVGADPDIQHAVSGFTAMHYAAQVGCHVIIKSLIAFGASVHIRDKDGQTPLDVARTSPAKTAQGCVRVLEETIQLMDQAAKVQSEPFVPVSTAADEIVLLSMDGGGSRGLLTCQTIASIQSRMRQLDPRCDPLFKHCDYVAGTSTGGLIALCLASGASLGATRATFFKVADEVFGVMRPTFSGQLVDETTKQTLGTEKCITDIKSPRLIVMTVLADRSPSVLHLVCNYGGARNGQKPPEEWKLWEVGRATSAAPFYFPLHEDKFIDGGVMANNPTLDAMVEIFNQAEREGKTAKVGLVVSIGTGVVPTTKVDNVGVLVPNLHNVRESIPGLFKTFSGLSHMLQLFIGQCTRSDGEEVERARVWCKSLGAAYVRFSCPLKEVVDLAESDKAVLTELMYQGTLDNLRRAKDVDNIARYLLSRQRHRGGVA